MHTLLDLRGSIPIFVDITEGSVHDINSLDKMPVEPGSYYIMDKTASSHFGVFTEQARTQFIARFG